MDDYLKLLELIAGALSGFGPRVAFILAAAVSDFYIPADKVHASRCPSPESP